jgi:hypothetical protein
MDMIRASIEAVRGAWTSYAEVPAFVCDFVASAAAAGGSDDECHFGVLERSLLQNRDWSDRLGGTADRDFPLIRHYTSNVGYETLFRELNRRYRTQALGESYEDFLPLTWIVELLNMELFAAARSAPHSLGGGSVYRGMLLPRRLLSHYSHYRSDELPLEQRAISIPLGLHSSSADRAIAHDFVGLDATRSQAEDRFALIWCISVVSLSDERLEQYHRFFPSSVVTSICANDISRLSELQLEREVLLRGAFFDVLDFREIAPIGGLDAYELHVLMMDNNRDHISTYELGDRDAEARKLFRQLVAAEKYWACADAAAAAGHKRLADRYREAAGTADEAGERTARELG